ncbi:hypothetical protein VCHENC01_2985B, partial [Vibrio harveyi]
AWQFRFAQV